MKYTIIISYSKSDLDNWDEGTKLAFDLETCVKLGPGYVNIASSYLDAAGIKYREFMAKLAEVAS